MRSRAGDSISYLQALYEDREYFIQTHRDDESGLSPRNKRIKRLLAFLLLEDAPLPEQKKNDDAFQRDLASMHSFVYMPNLSDEDYQKALVFFNDPDFKQALEPIFAEERRENIEELLEVLISDFELLKAREDDDSFQSNLATIRRLVLMSSISEEEYKQALLFFNDPDIRDALETKLEAEKKQLFSDTTATGHSSAFEALKIVLSDMNKLVDVATDRADVGITNFRNPQVIGNILANGINSDANNPDSFFNQLTNFDNGLNPVGWTIAGSTGVFALLGLMQYHYKEKHRLDLMSYPHLQASTTAIDPELQLTHYQMVSDLNKILQKKVADGAKSGYVISRNKYHVRFINKKKVKEQVDVASGTVTAVDGNESPSAENQGGVVAGASHAPELTKIKLSPDKVVEETFEPNFFIRQVNKIRNSAVGDFLAQAWSTTVIGMMSFWVSWYPLMLIVGGVVLAGSSPILAAVSLIPVAGYAGLRVLQYGVRKAYNKWGKKQTSQTEIEDEILARRVMVDYVIKKQHAFNSKMIAAAFGQNLDQLKEKWKQRKVAQYQDWIQSKKTEKQQAATNDADKTLYLNQSKVGAYLLGVEEAQERKRTAMIKNFLDGVVLSLFILWLLSTGVLAVTAIPLIPLAASALFGTASSWIGGALVGVIGGSIIGTILGVNHYARVQEEQAKYQQKVLEKLSEPYVASKKHTGENPEFVMTKLEKFQQLEQSLEREKAEIIHLRQRLKALGGEDLLSDAEKRVALQYNLDEVDVYNDYYFEKQKQNPSTFSKVKRVGAHAFEFLGGSQSGIFLTRFFFLGGLGLAGVLAATGYGLPLVLGVGLAAGLVYGAVRLMNYQMERKRLHKNFFLETFDERIHYMSSKESELVSTKELLLEKVTLAGASKKKADAQGRRVQPKLKEEKKVTSIFSSFFAKKEKPAGNQSRIESESLLGNRGMGAARRIQHKG